MKQPTIQDIKLVLKKDLGVKIKPTTESILLGMGKDQENLIEVLWLGLWPYILLAICIYVYIGSTNTYHISPYPRTVGLG